MKMTKTKKTVYIVHCIDTEGPLYEEKNVPFQMIKNIFGIDIEPTQENLHKLQCGELDLKGEEKEVQKIVDKHRITTRGSWQEIDEMIKKVTSNSFRNKLLDSNGKGWIFNWFCMDHVGFTGINPRRRECGYHKIFDHYTKLIKEQNCGDYIGFHYHPLPLSGNYHESGTAYWGGENLNQILSRDIIDRGWFPASFRPGFHTERPDSNWFLEQWIPFDYGNQAMFCNAEGQIDLAAGRYGDWRHAPIEWYPYHPSHDDYQSKGECRRWITRCLNMYARTRQIEQSDVFNAFCFAEQNGKAILAFTDHDYKDMEFEITRIRDMISLAKEKFPNVDFIYSNSISAMRESLGLAFTDFEMKVEIKEQNNRNILVVQVNNDIFGPQPFLAIKDKNGRYMWDNFDVSIKNREWTYTFDNNTINRDMIDTVGVATNNNYGVTKIVLLNGNKISKYQYNL